MSGVKAKLFFCVSDIEFKAKIGFEGRIDAALRKRPADTVQGLLILCSASVGHYVPA